MIHRIVQGLVFVITTSFALEAHAQTFVTRSALGGDRDERRDSLRVPSLSAISGVVAPFAERDARQVGDTTAAEAVIAATQRPVEITADYASWLSEALRRANRTARLEPREFEQQLDLSAAYPNLPLPQTRVGEAVAITALVNDKARFEQFIRAADPDVRPQLERRKEELLGRVTAAQADDRLSAKVFADGTIRGTAEGTSGPEGVGTGSLGVSLEQGRRLWYAALTVASTEDTLSDNFGPALLAPGSGKALASGIISALYRDWLATGFAFHPYLSSSRHLWKVADTTRAATVLGFGALLRRELGSQDVGGKNVSLLVDVGPMMRFLGGDILSLGDSTRAKTIGTSNTAFFGIETGATLSVGDLVGSAQLYYLFGDNEDRVLGLSNLQLVAGFSIKGELFRPTER